MAETNKPAEPKTGAADTKADTKPASKAPTKAVFLGPNGAKFVPARTISPRTIAARVKANTWKPQNAEAKSLAARAAKSAAEIKAAAKTDKV